MYSLSNDSHVRPFLVDRLTLRCFSTQRITRTSHSHICFFHGPGKVPLHGSGCMLHWGIAEPHAPLYYDIWSFRKKHRPTLHLDGYKVEHDVLLSFSNCCHQVRLKGRFLSLKLLCNISSNVHRWVICCFEPWVVVVHFLNFVKLMRDTKNFDAKHKCDQTWVWELC